MILKPRLVFCKREHSINTDSALASIVIGYSGWGLLIVKSQNNAEWQGLKFFLNSGKDKVTLIAPKSSNLKVSFFNLFGFDRIKYNISSADSSLGRIAVPGQAAIKKSTIFSLFFVSEIKLSLKKDLGNYKATRKRKVTYSIPFASNIEVPKPLSYITPMLRVRYSELKLDI